jgi:hypothetical protein
MNKLVSGLVLTFLVASTGAQAGPWCAFYDSSTYNCGFHSYAQCYATIYGERRLVPTKHFRAICPGSPVEKGRPLLAVGGAVVTRSETTDPNRSRVIHLVRGTDTVGACPHALIPDQSRFPSTPASRLNTDALSL